METGSAAGWTNSGAGVVLVRGLLARCDARETASDRDWKPGPGHTKLRDIPEGKLVLTASELAEGGDWALAYWRPEGDLIPLGQGTLTESDCYAREVVLFGLPGGIRVDVARAWRVDEGSLRKETATPAPGAHRIMVQPGGLGTLVFVRHDHRVVYLGEEGIDELKATADERLLDPRRRPLRVWFAGQFLELHGLGFLGGVGQVEVGRGNRLMLVQVGRDRFELHFTTRTGECEVVGEYRGADLERGDLGPLRVAGPAKQGAMRTDDGDARPRRPPPHGHARARSVAATGPAPRRTEPPRPSSDDHRRLANGLSPGQVPNTGIGVSDMPGLYAAFRVLVTLGLENMLLWAHELRDLIKTKAQVQFRGTDRTFIRALARFVERTGLGRRDGRRFWLFFGDLRRGDSEVWATIRERFLPIEEEPPPADTTPASRVAVPAPPTATTPPTSDSAAPAPPTATAAPDTPPEEAAAGFVGDQGHARAASTSPDGFATMDVREDGLEFGPDDSTAAPPPPSNHRDGRRRYWTPTRDRGWYDNGPSQFQGKKKSRGPPRGGGCG